MDSAERINRGFKPLPYCNPNIINMMDAVLIQVKKEYPLKHLNSRNIVI